jgi:methyl-accepting chemotaxis protein
VDNVAEGGKLVGEAGGIITEIVTSVERVTELIAGIAVASKEQSAGVEEINKAIVQMESVTQQNAALVEQVGAATLSFEEEAKRLNDTVAQFKSAARAHPSAAVRPAQAAVPRRQAKPLPARSAPVFVPRGQHDEWKEF